MNPLRLVIVTRQFWPMSGPVELAAGDLAVELKRQGHQVEIVTARWGKAWPEFFVAREIPAYRIARPTAGPWGSFRFQRALSRFLDRSFSEGKPIDGVIVFGLGQETETVLRTIQNRSDRTVVITRVDSKDEPYHRWHQNSTKKTLANLPRTDAVIADSELTRRHLARHVPDEKLKVVFDGVSDTVEARSNSNRNRARRSLTDAHPILVIEPDHPLVVTAAPLGNDGGVIDLVESWPTVIKSRPRAKLWILGDGSHGQQVWNAITSRSLVHSVIMPGYFDDLSDVFEAADLYVHPNRNGESCSGLTRAMACGLCPVATATSFSDPLVERDVTGLLTPAGNPDALAEAIIHGLNQTDLRTRLGNAAKSRVLESIPISEQANVYINLISQRDSVAETSP